MTDLASVNMNANTSSARIDFNTPALQRKRRIRAFKDHLTRWYVGVGGLAVLAAITLIFFYLAYVVLPLFQGASLSKKADYTPTWAAELGKPLLLSIEEQNEIGLFLDKQGQAVFFSVADGAERQRFQLPLPAGVSISAIGQDQPGSERFVLGLSNGQALVVQTGTKVSYPNDVKVVEPVLNYPYGNSPLTLDPQGRALEHVGVAAGDESLLVSASVGSELLVLSVTEESNLFTGETTLTEERIALPQIADPIKAVIVEPRQQWLYVINGRATADVFDLRSKQLLGRYKLSEDGNVEVTSASLLLGGISLMVGDSKGGIGQWFMVRDKDDKFALKHIRQFQQGDAPIVQVSAEQRRKGFVALDEAGQLGVFHSTAERTLLIEPLQGGAQALALSPRANRVLSVDDKGEFHLQRLDNKHPEISWNSLWSKVWYETYDKPEYIWQSTAANTDFEPKMSLAPLTFGTLKAAFYAMLLAAPLAIAAAIYTAYFMAPAMRRKVKPVIELMEALPTVILGFFAGLFLAPYVENHLPGIFSLLILTPLGILLAGFIWSRLPERIRLSVPAGWEAAILIPVVLATAVFALSISPTLEVAFFNGDMRLWISNDLGITYDQRNALIVGLAMGFAVIPNIFSIAEDAVFSVPKSLTYGSLALGATPWQTLTRVVILTASPGIFSALMIGMGRAVGETMIVLMSTGNTPLMEANLFEGMRTLAANVAVEMPESELGSTHYRVLFLSALVLLSFTFVMNTLAEVIRQRLRKKYASL